MSLVASYLPRERRVRVGPTGDDASIPRSCRTFGCEVWQDGFYGALACSKLDGKPHGLWLRACGIIGPDGWDSLPQSGSLFFGLIVLSRLLVNFVLAGAGAVLLSRMRR